MAALALSHRPRLVAAGLVLGLLVALALVGPGQTRSASGQEPATPVCPAGSTFNAATGQCETPGIAQPCPAGTTLVGTTCTTTVTCTPVTPDPEILPPLRIARTISGDPRDGTSATCTASGAFPETISCPPGTTITAFSPGTPGETTGGGVGANGTITCTVPQAFVCPPGFTPSGTVCMAPPTFTCPPGFTLSGPTCLPPATTTTTTPLTTLPLGGTAGDADASGGDGGSARGGDGGRGGSGTLPVCNQNTNDSSWEELVQEVDEEGYVVDEYVIVHEAEPSVDCGAGGRGGAAGDAGISEGGDGGLAFSVG